jgi:DNA-binding transcriptional MerR regulator
MDGEPMLMELLEVSEAARVIGVSAQTMRMLDKRGALNPFAVTGRGLRLYQREEVERYARLREARTKKPKPS